MSAGQGGHQVRTAYDALRRPTESYLRQGAGPELLVERTVYGETRPNPEASNLRGKVVQLFDQAGVVTSDDYDFKGNLRCSQRQLAQEYKKILDWSGAMPLEAQTYANRTRYDALNRPTELTTPDNSVIHPTYNEANLLEQVQANLRGVATATLFIANIDYNAKGQRTLIEYGNGASTSYAYDPDTFRLIHLRTTRRLPSLGSRLLGLLGRQPAPHPETVQDLSYTYDPAGNITHIGDDAQQTIYFRNQRVEPSADYTYDAMYRLIEAKGREHLGQTGGQPNPPTAPDAFNAFHTRCDHPGDGKAMGTYSERYVYDAVGNILEMQHRGSDPAHPGWTRSYSYHEASLIEPTRQSNRLSQTTVGNNNPPVERYVHDAHGNMIRMPHLGGAHPAPNMYWDYKDELRQADLGGGGTAYYVYDAAGQRVRKVWEKSAGLTEERIYLSGFEVFRRRSGAGAVRLQRETLHVMDDKQRIALVETRTQGDEPAPQQLIRYQISNHLGSASLELDDDGQIISYEEYYPYGSTSYQAVRNQTETPKRYRYTGKERDEESGLEYHLARYYLPWLGRWVSADPAGFDGGINLYEYCRSNPIRWVDLGGKEPNDYPQQMPSSGVLIPNTSPPLSTSSGTPKPNPIDSKTSPNVYAIPSPPQRQGASFGSTLLSILFFPLIALSGCSSSAPKPGGTVTGSHVIIAGATSVNDPGGHDKKGPTGGWNYLNAAANRTKDIKKNDPTAKVTVIMYSPENLGYQKRGVDEGKGKYHFENLMRDSAKRNGFELIIIRKADQLTPMLNTAKDGQIKQLEYFGHSDQNNFLLEYSSDIPRGSTDYWGKNDIAGVRKGIFAAGGKVNLYGCNLGAPGGLGQEMKHKWGLKVTAADTRTDYVPLTGSAWKPSGHYIEMK